MHISSVRMQFKTLSYKVYLSATQRFVCIMPAPSIMKRKGCGGLARSRYRMGGGNSKQRVQGRDQNLFHTEQKKKQKPQNPLDV